MGRLLAWKLTRPSWLVGQLCCCGPRERQVRSQQPIKTNKQKDNDGNERDEPASETDWFFGDLIRWERLMSPPSIELFEFDWVLREATEEDGSRDNTSLSISTSSTSHRT